MNKYSVAVEIIKKASKATRWIRVDADSSTAAMRLAQNAAKAAPSVLKAAAKAVRVVR